MSAEVTTRDLDAARRSRPVAATLADADALLEATFADLTDTLARVAAEGGPHAGFGVAVDAPRHGGDPLGVDLVGELAERSRNHGKRLRPVLAHWGWVVAGGGEDTREDVVRLAAALELLHLFALLQDDVMDRSDSRRGRTTLHVSAAARHDLARGLGDAAHFGDGVATLVSDLALSEATLLVAPTAPPVRAAWRLMTVELVQGQLLDLTHTAGRRRDLATARRIGRFKSGRYTISRPVQLGALVGGAPDALVRDLVAWGDLVGDAFAVRDDVLGVWGDPAVTGKPSGDDLRCGKPTALLSWASDLLPEQAQELLAACDAGELDAAGVRDLQRAMADAGVRERAEQTISDLVTLSHRALDALDVDAEAERALRELAEAIAWRTT